MRNIHRFGKNQKREQINLMKQKPILVLIISALFASLFLAGCGGQKALTDAEKDSVETLAEPIAETILQSFSTKDYTAFSQDFDSKMLSALPQGQFESLAASFEQKLGAYQSKEVQQVTNAGDFYSVIYNLTFTKAQKVTFRLVITKSEPHEVSGIWFNSPELQK
jgi:PBP1b-binding outer membrane lipoprotein LpoB